MDQLPQYIVNGIAVGSIIALAAVGLTLSLGILRLSNFAHGDFMTLGAYFTWLTNKTGLNIWLSMIVGVIGTIITMLISEKLIWQPMRIKRTNTTTLTIISIGLALFIRNGISLIWGSNNQSYNLPVAPPIDILGVKIPVYRLLLVILSIIAMIVLHFILQKTKIGKAMRAVADDIDLAKVTGIDVDQVVIWTWIIIGILTAIGGAMFGLPPTDVRPNMGWFLLLPIFASVILGGIGNPYGAIAGAMIIGITQEVSVIWLGSQYKLAVGLVIMMLMLLFRPQGLFKMN